MSFTAFLGILRRRIWVIVACLVILPAGALAYARLKPKHYSATARVLLSDPTFEQSIVGQNLPAPTGGLNQDQNLSTEVSIASLDVIGRRAAVSLGGSFAVSHSLPGSVAVVPNGSSNVVAVTSTEATAGLSARVANAYARQYINFRRGVDVRRIDTARRQIRRDLTTTSSQAAALTVALTTARGTQASDLAAQLSAAQAQATQLRSRYAQLGTMRSLQNGNATLVQGASVPSAPNSASTITTLFAGVGLGMLLGIGLALLFDLVDRRFQRTDDIESVFEGPILGAIPHSRQLASGSSDHRRLPLADKESFAMVHANMSHFNAPVRSVMVTSATPGEGKSTVAWNIAAAGVNEGRKVLLIEADLRNPTFEQRLQIQAASGLSDVLRGHQELSKAVYHLAVGDPNGNGSSGHARASVEVLFAGPPPPNARALIGSQAMVDLIRQAEAEYDLVVIDTPPTTVVSDAVPLAKVVSGVLVVMRLRMSTRDSAEHLSTQLENLGARTLGVVVNDIGRLDGYYGTVPSYVRESVPDG